MKPLQYRVVIGERPTVVPGTDIEIGPNDLIMNASRPLPGWYTFYIAAASEFAEQPDTPSSFVPTGLAYPSFKISQFFPCWGFYTVLRLEDCGDPTTRRALIDALALDGSILYYVPSEEATEYYYTYIEQRYGADRLQRFKDSAASVPDFDHTIVANAQRIMEEQDVWQTSLTHRMWQGVLDNES